MSVSSKSAGNPSCSTRAKKAKKQNKKNYLFNENITLKATPSVVSIQ